MTISNFAAFSKITNKAWYNKYHTLFFSKIRKELMLQNLLSAAVVFGAFRVNFFHTLCMLAAKALGRLDRCAGWSEPWLLANVISTNISYWDQIFFSNRQHQNYFKNWDSQTSTDWYFIYFTRLVLTVLPGLVQALREYSPYFRRTQLSLSSSRLLGWKCKPCNRKKGFCNCVKATTMISLCSLTRARSLRLLKTIMLNSTEHEIYPAHKC